VNKRLVQLATRPKPYVLVDSPRPHRLVWVRGPQHLNEILSALANPLSVDDDVIEQHVCA